jgi:hypothetical protein
VALDFIERLVKRLVAKANNVSFLAMHVHSLPTILMMISRSAMTSARTMRWQLLLRIKQLGYRNSKFLLR